MDDRFRVQLRDNDRNYRDHVREQRQKLVVPVIIVLSLVVIGCGAVLIAVLNRPEPKPTATKPAKPPEPPPGSQLPLLARKPVPGGVTGSSLPPIKTPPLFDQPQRPQNLPPGEVLAVLPDKGPPLVAPPQTDFPVTTRGPELMFRIEGMTRSSRYGTLVLNVRLINLTDDRNVILRRPLPQVVAEMTDDLGNKYQSRLSRSDEGSANDARMIRAGDSWQMVFEIERPADRARFITISIPAFDGGFLLTIPVPRI